MQKSNFKDKKDTKENKKHPIALIRGIKRVLSDIENIKDKDLQQKASLKLFFYTPGFMRF